MVEKPGVLFYFSSDFSIQRRVLHRMILLADRQIFSPPSQRNMGKDADVEGNKLLSWKPYVYVKVINCFLSS